jgi:hypothetical protein
VARAAIILLAATATLARPAVALAVVVDLVAAQVAPVAATAQVAVAARVDPAGPAAHAEHAPTSLDAMTFRFL